MCVKTKTYDLTEHRIIFFPVWRGYIYLLDSQHSFVTRIDVYAPDRGLNLFKHKNIWTDTLK